MNIQDIYLKSRPIAHLQNLINSNKSSIIQPLNDLMSYNQAARIETAVNHENGGVRCVTSFKNIKD
jgi:hypothetical protein